MSGRFTLEKGTAYTGLISQAKCAAVPFIRAAERARKRARTRKMHEYAARLRAWMRLVCSALVHLPEPLGNTEIPRFAGIPVREYSYDKLVTVFSDTSSAGGLEKTALPGLDPFGVKSRLTAALVRQEKKCGNFTALDY